MKIENKKVAMVTGCAGFIGYHLTRHLLEKGWYIMGVDNLSYSSRNNFIATKFNEYDNFFFVEKDINDLDRLPDCDYIINCAAETHVDNSIENSDDFVHSNISGVHHILKLMERIKNQRPILLHFSTDEVYGDIKEGEHFETDALNPSNPYSATKAAADMLILAWARTHNIKYFIVRPTNNYGINQHPEKLIPKTCKNFLLGRKLPLHNDGTPVRNWLHVSDTVKAVSTILEHGTINNTYNIPGNYEERNIVIVNKIIKILSPRGIDLSVYDLIDYSYSRPGQDVRYALNGDKLKSLGWKAVADFDKELKKIVNYNEDYIEELIF